MTEEMKAGATDPAAANTAQTSGQESAPLGKTDAGAEEATGESTVSFEDTSNVDADNEQAENKSDEKPATDDKGKKARGEKNAKIAEKRREAERARELKETREKAIIEALGGKNPYTGRPMKDGDDVAEFLSMQEIEKKGGDPVTDFPEHQKAKARAEREKEAKAREEQEWFENDRTAFTEKYPKVDLDALIADEDFADYADGKVGVKPLAEIYEGYLRQSARFEERARTRAAQAVANREASPGSLGSAGAADTGFYTPEQVDAMSKSEVKKNLDKINESMKHWK